MFGAIIAPIIFGVSLILIFPDIRSSYGKEVRHSSTFKYAVNVRTEANASLERLLSIREWYETSIFVTCILAAIAGGVIGGINAPKK
jgi:hypothetical protein